LILNSGLSKAWTKSGPMAKYIAPILDVLPHQLRFAELGISTPDRFGALLSGFGAGKSAAIPVRVLNILRHRNRLGQYADITIAAPTYSLLQDINIPDMEEFFERYKVKNVPIKGKRQIRVTSKNLRGLIRFKSLHRPERIVGWNGSDFIADEFDILRYQDQVQAWRNLNARIRKFEGATGTIATTPEGFRYTWELFEKGIGPEGNKRTVGPLIRARTQDNIFLPQDYIDSQLALYDSELIRQYMEGYFVNINGRAAYYAFNRDPSAGIVIPYRPVKPSALFLSIDFNVDPLTATCWYQDGQRSIAFREYWLRNSYTERLIEVVRGDFPNTQVIAYPDMTGVKRQTSRESGGAARSDLAILRNAGWQIKGKTNPYVRDRLAAMNNAFNKGLIQIMENCEHLIEDCERVVVDEYGELDKSNKMLTHASDNAGYFVSANYPIRKPRSYQK